MHKLILKLSYQLLTSNFSFFLAIQYQVTNNNLRCLVWLITTNLICSEYICTKIWNMKLILLYIHSSETEAIYFLPKWISISLMPGYNLLANKNQLFILYLRYQVSFILVQRSLIETTIWFSSKNYLSWRNETSDCFVWRV